MSQLDSLGAESLKLCVARGRCLAVGRLEPHAREWINQWNLAGVASRGDIPGAAATRHCLVEHGAPFAFNHTTSSVNLFDDQKLLVQRVDDCGINQDKAQEAEAAAVLQDMAADQAEAGFMIAPGHRVELGEPTIAAELGK